MWSSVHRVCMEGTLLSSDWMTFVQGLVSWHWKVQCDLFAVKVEPSGCSPMETSTPITPTCSTQPHAADTLPTLSPKGGNVPDVKSASELPHGVKLESAQDSLSAGSGGGGGGVGGGAASSADTINNNSGLGGQDRNASSASEGQRSNGAPSSASNKNSAISLDCSSGHLTGGSNQNSALSFTPSLQDRAPDTWTAQDVCLFLSVNDCGACSEVVLRRVRRLLCFLQSGQYQEFCAKWHVCNTYIFNFFFLSALNLDPKHTRD